MVMIGFSPCTDAEMQALSAYPFTPIGEGEVSDSL
jgi:hypothetical protein